MTVEVVNLKSVTQLQAVNNPKGAIVAIYHSMHRCCPFESVQKPTIRQIMANCNCKKVPLKHVAVAFVSSSVTAYRDLC